MNVLRRRKLSRPVVIIGALAGLALAVFLAAFMSRGSQNEALAHFPPLTGTPTGTPHNALDFSMGVNTDGNTATGDQRPDGHGSPRGDDCVSTSKLIFTPTPTATPAAGSTCYVPPGASFTVNFYLNDLGGISNYGGFDLYLQYTGVTLPSPPTPTPLPAFDKSSWPSCGFPAFNRATPAIVFAACAAGVGTPSSAYVGRIASGTFVCTANGSITMVHGSGKTDLAQAATPAGTAVIETHGEVQGSTETLTIICNVPEISLKAQSLSGGVSIVCDTPVPPSTKPQRCTAPVLPTPTVGAFQLIVDANHIGAGYGGFNSEVLFGGLDYFSRSCLNEVVWPQMLVCSFAPPAPTPGTPMPLKQYRSRSQIVPPFPISTYAGDLLRMNVDCPREGQYRIMLPAYYPVSGTATPVRTQAAAYFDANETPVPVSTVSIEPLDTNGDGVPDTTPSYPIASSLLINCVAQPTVAPTNTPAATPTPGAATATPTASPTASPTPCGGPCPTPSATNTPGPTNTFTPAPTQTPGPACLETASQTLSVPGKVTDGAGATGTDQLETSVVTAGPGQVTICERLPVLPNPPGYNQFGQQADISAPQATTARPLTIVFWLDVSVVPAGATADQVAVFRDGAIVAPCAGTPEAANPNPCVSNRVTLTGSQAGDVRITILSSVASSWTFAVSSGLPGDVNCDGHVNSVDAALILQNVAGLLASLPCPQNADVNGDGLIDSRDALLILQYTAGLIHSLPAGAGRGLSVWSGLAGLAAWLGAR